MNRAELIAYIKTNSRGVSYDVVNFDFFNEWELMILKRRIEEENEEEDKQKKHRK